MLQGSQELTKVNSRPEKPPIFFPTTPHYPVTPILYIDAENELQSAWDDRKRQIKKE